jgi:hypothetical protein
MPGAIPQDSHVAPLDTPSQVLRFEPLESFNVEGLDKPTQETRLRRLYERGGVAFRVVIVSDASNPTRAAVDRFDGAAWQELVTLPHNLRATPLVSNYLPAGQRGAIRDAFKRDEAELLRRAALILDPAGAHAIRDCDLCGVAGPVSDSPCKACDDKGAPAE